jgi:fibronectin type 3 domain-containing protein
VTVTNTGSQSGSLTNGFTYVAATTITYVQGTDADPQASPVSVPITFAAAQAAGDLNVVVVGWNDSTATVSSVTDKSGNTYTRAVGPTIQSGTASQSIYYAKNIVAAAAGANIVTVTFSSAAAFPDIRILEYSGADPNNPVDVTAASSGNSTTSSSGAVTTTNATDLIFGANLVQSFTTGPGAGFTQRMLSSPDGDIAEDRMVTTTGSYTATATITPGQWIMQMVAFRTPSGGTTVPTVTSVSPNSGPTAGGTAVTIAGTNFAAGATVTFGATAATNVMVVSGTQITATTPAGSAGAVSVAVTVSGQSGSLAGGYTYVAPPTVTVVSPNTGSTGGGTAVTITGTNFATGATVTFGATAATNVVVASNTSITATTPAGSAGSVTVKVTVGSQSGSLTNGFTYAAIPGVTSVSPNSGPAAGGTAVTITGSNFAAGATVTFGGAAATNVVVVSGTSITATAPAGSAGAVTVAVTVSGQSGNLASGFTYIGVPTVTGVSPNTGPTAGGTAVTITGTNFAAGATVAFSAAATNVVVVNSTSITATTPAGAAGAVTVAVTNPGNQSGSLASAFTYVAPTPSAPGSLSAVDGGPAPSVANVQGYYSSTFLTTHTTAAFDSTGGNTIVLFVSSHSGVTLTPSDSFGNTWIPIAGPTNAGTAMGFDLRSQLWYAQNPTVGSNHTITINLPFAQPLAMSVIVVQGANAASPIDAVSLIGSDNLTQATNVVSPSITTTGINDLLVGFGKVSSGVTFQPGAGFTQQAGASSNYLDAETGLAATPGTYAATFTISSPQSWESAVVAAANSPNQTTLTWNASTEAGGTISQYLVERCQGAACSIFAQIGTAATTAFNDTALSLATSYSYRVRAQDAAGTLGPYSTVVTVVTPASTPSTPSAPGNINAGGPIVITGLNANDGNSLTSHTSAAFDSTGGDVIVLAASSVAGVTLTPSDSFGNTWTSVAGPTSTTQGSDLRTQLWYSANPSVGPGHTITVGLSAAEPLTMSIVVAKGSNTSSPIDAASLIGSDNGTQTGNVVSPTVTTTGINDLLVGFAQDSAGANFLAGPGFTEAGTASSSYLDAETAPAATPGTYAANFLISGQTWLSAVVAVANNPSQATLSWTPSGEIGGTQVLGAISSYLVERCQGSGCANFAQIATTPASTFTDTGLAASSSYNYRVRAGDTAGGIGPYSSVVTVNTSGSLPSAPGNLSAASNRQGTINLAWAASSSVLGIADYIVQRCLGAGCANFAQIGIATGTTYIDSAVSPSTTYTYQVQAVDNAGNQGPFSNPATATTVGNQPPTAPGNLTATAVGSSQINLSWTASTSSIGLANYVVQRCQGAGCTNFVQVGTPAGTTFSDTGLPSGSSNSYQVQAIDIEGNMGPFSSVATATTTAGTTTITYVQGNYATPQSFVASVNVTFQAAQAAGDLNVVVVGWNDSNATVSAVTDRSGNTYTRAVGPTAIAGTLSQSIYYAKSIAPAGAGANIVTVTFSVAAAYPDIRILEYNGADPGNPVDVTAGTSGNSGTSNSGSAITTNATDLLFGANMVATTTVGPGSGFTTRLLTSPDSDIAEDRMVAATGSYSATAIIGSGQWVMQMVAFRSVPLGPTPSVSLSSASINFGNQATGGTTDPQFVILTNVGTAQLAISSLTMSGGNSGDFAQTNNCPATVAVNANCTINVTFTPTTTGIRSSSVLIADNAPGSPQSISLSGTGTGFTVSPSVITLTFSQTQQFTASSGSPTWLVDGTVGGTAASGTITGAGLYAAPASSGTHTVTATTGSQSASATVYVSNYSGTFTYHNDNLRTGQNLNETVLTPSNVNQTQFGKLFSYPLDATAFASPLYVPNVSIPGKGSHNVVYVATENDSVYAFDADGLSGSPLWQRSFLSSGVTTVPCGDVGECGDIPTQYGITSTPVIDPSTGTIYVVAATKEGVNTWVQRLHALDITTGTEKFGGPVVLQGSVNGTGSGSSGGKVAFNPLLENQRPGILLSNGVVYLAFGSHGDVSPWHGWVLGYNATTLLQTMIYNDTPNGDGGGIWQGGGGLASDATGGIYFVTSNGNFDANTGGADYGDTVEKLNPAGSVADYFTPHDQANMSAQNLDLGAGGPVMLVDQPTGLYPHLLITAGKSGTIYVINRDNMGKFHSGNDNQIVQALVGVLPNGNEQTGNFSTPVYFNGYVYFSAVNDYLKAFQMSGGLLSLSPASQTSTLYQVRGGSFGISANGNTNGILWALQNNGASADNDVGNPGVLFAYDANNLANKLYDSTQAGSRDTMDNAAKFSVPLVANGKVFVAGQTQLTAYGLLP